MRIYDTPAFPNPLRVRIALAEKGMSSEITFIPVDLPNAEHKQPPFLAMNPEGTVPVLELDDGTFISECTAITTYFDRLDGEPILTGGTPKEIAVIQMMQKRAERELLYAVGNYFHYGTPGGGPILEAYKRPNWKGRTEWAHMERDRALAGMRYFDGLLEKQPYVGGETYSMADITVWAGLYFADLAQIPISGEYAALWAWRGELNERSAIKHPA